MNSRCAVKVQFYERRPKAASTTRQIYRRVQVSAVEHFGVLRPYWLEMREMVIAGQMTEGYSFPLSCRRLLEETKSFPATLSPCLVQAQMSLIAKGYIVGGCEHTRVHTSTTRPLGHAPNTRTLKVAVDFLCRVSKLTDSREGA